MNKYNISLIIILFLIKFIRTENIKHEVKHEVKHEEHSQIPFGTSEYYFYAILSFFIVCFAGAMSGLTVGYLSIDKKFLEIKSRNGTKLEKEYSSRIKPILKDHHLLLTTLLLSNAVAMESLPIFLHKLFPASIAILLSTSFVLIFGEVVPQALCTGKNQLKIASTLAPFVKILMKILFIICYPISLCLDMILGIHKDENFVKKDLKALMELQAEGSSSEEGLLFEEIKLITSIFDLRDKKVEKYIKPIDDIFMINENKIIDLEYLKKINKSNYSIIPICKNDNKQNIVGLVKTKNLIDQDNFLNKTISENLIKKNNKILFVPSNTNLLELLDLLKENKQNIAFVVDYNFNKKINDYSSKRLANINNNDNRKVLGMITMKKIFENIVKSKLDDNDEHYVNKDGKLIRQYSRFNSYKSGMKKLENVEMVEMVEPPERNIEEKLI